MIKMFTELFKFDSYLDIIGIIVICLFLLAVLGIIIFVFKKIEFGKNGIVLEKRQKKTKLEVNYVSLIYKLMEKYNEVLQTERNIYRRQKKILIEKIELLSSKDIDLFLNLLSEKTNKKKEELYDSEDYHNYKNINYRFMSKTKEIFKNIFKENHLDKIVDLKEWNNYKKDKTEFIINSTNVELERNYTLNDTVSLDDLKKYQKDKLKDYYILIINEILDNARNISVVDNKKIRKLKKQLESFIEDVLGINININMDMDN